MLWYFCIIFYFAGNLLMLIKTQSIAELVLETQLFLFVIFSSKEVKSAIQKL